MKLREAYIEGTTSLSAPDLLLIELSNAFRYKPGFDEKKVTRAITDVVDLQIDLITPSRELMDKATEDAYARALGELMEIVVYTSDKKFYEKAKLSGRRTHRP